MSTLSNNAHPNTNIIMIQYVNSYIMKYTLDER